MSAEETLLPAARPRVANRLLRAVLGIAAMMGLGVACQFGAHALEDVFGVVGPLRPGLNSLALIPGMLVGYILFVKLIERRRLAEFAAAAAVPQLTGGVVLGTGLFLLTMAPLWVMGLYQLDGFNGPEVLMKPLVLALVPAVFEELLFRGLIQRIIEERFGSLWALGVTSLLFGLAHGFNPGASPYTFLIIAGEAGLLLGGAWVATRKLWLVMGLHFAWNFVQGGVFGEAVSGNRLDGLLDGSLHGPVWLTGGAFGPEASVQAIALAAVSGLIMVAIAARRGRLIPPLKRGRGMIGAGQFA